MHPHRRALLAALAAWPALPLVGARAQEPRLELTPECPDSDEPTVAQTEGPFFTPGAPFKHDLAADVPEGEPILIGGFVLDTRCRPVPRTAVQLWHADARGRYDNEGYRLRGHQLTDARGLWWFSTIVPGLYPGRTRHYHVKVQRPDGGVLTTQLYFPDEPANRRDRIFDPRLVMHVSGAGADRLGRFDFVV